MIDNKEPIRNPKSAIRSRNSLQPTLKGLYQRWRRYVPVGIFFSGFLWDSLTLNRIDHLLDNLVLLGYLVVLGIMIVFTLRAQAGVTQAPWIRKLERHFRWIMQFFLGGLLAKYVVFYFKSASWTRTSVFLILLVILLVSNEFLEHRLENPKLLAVLFLFCLFSFLAFFLPVILARIDAWTFLLAGWLSLGLTFGVFILAVSKSPVSRWARIKSLGFWILCTYLALNLFYFANLIPPVPLAMKAAGIYHHVSKTAEGYKVRYVAPPWYRFWKQWEDPFYYTPGEAVYCYTAIFAPQKIHFPLHHRWSRYSPQRGWMETDRIIFEITGGREGGYRGFSIKRALAPGRWRVEVETDGGRILGRIDFTVVLSPIDHPSLESRILS